MTKEISTLTEFIEWTEQFSSGQYLFRGISNEKYEIEASASRRLGKNSSNPTKLLKINKEMIDDARLEGHDLKDGHRLSDLELLAELQHYGAATCLIDFTYSAQIALWMACRQRPKWNVNGKVFAVRSNDPIRFKKITSDSLQKRLDCFFKMDERGGYPLYRWQPKQQNNRIIAQQSVFLFGGAKIKPDTECVVIKDSKEAILASLEKSSGITEARVFPDFDGFARLRAHNRLYMEPNACDYMQRGIEAAQENRWDDAVAYYNEVISLQPVDDLMLANTHYYRGYAYENQGKYDLAITDYSEAIKLSPDAAQIYHNRGIVYMIMHQIDLAVKDYDKVIELNPDSSFAYFQRATVYENNGQIDLAIKDHSKVIELMPDEAKPYHYFLRGIARLRIQDWEGARADFIASENNGSDIIPLFSEKCSSITAFEEEFGVELPGDISAILTRQ